MPARHVALLHVRRARGRRPSAPRPPGSPRSGCRRAPRAWCGRGRRRRRSRRWSGGWRRPGRPPPRPRPTARPGRARRCAACPAGSGSNLLKIGSITIGERRANAAPSATTAPDPGIHQRRGKRRISPIRIAAPPPARTASIAVALATSPSPRAPAPGWRGPTSSARSWRTAASGSVDHHERQRQRRPRGGRADASAARRARSERAAHAARRPHRDHSEQDPARSAPGCPSARARCGPR